MEVRRLQPGDERLAADACRIFGGDGDVDPTEFLSRPETTVLVGVDGSGVTGWVYGHELPHPDGEKTMMLYALNVAERARRQGVGTALVAQFVDDARIRGCTEVWVLTDDANPAAIATYRRSGGRRDKVPQVMFKWKLAEGRHS